MRTRAPHFVVERARRDRRRAAHELRHGFFELLRRRGVVGREEIHVEGNLADRLARRFGQQLEQLQHLVGTAEIGFDCLAEDLLELFAVFERRGAVLALDREQESLVTSVACQRRVFVAVGDEFERFLAAQPLVSRLQVDFEVLFAAGFVDVVVAAIHCHVHAAHFRHRALEAGEVRDEHVVYGEVPGAAQQMLDRFDHQLHTTRRTAALLVAVRVGGVDAIRDHFAVGRRERHLKLARDRKHRDRWLARIDPDKQHLVGMRIDLARGIALRRRAFVVADKQQRLRRTLARGRERLWLELHLRMLAQRFDDLVDLAEREGRGPGGGQQHDRERAREEPQRHGAPLGGWLGGHRSEWRRRRQRTARRRGRGCCDGAHELVLRCAAIRLEHGSPALRGLRDGRARCSRRRSANAISSRRPSPALRGPRRRLARSPRNRGRAAARAAGNERGPRGTARCFQASAS